MRAAEIPVFVFWQEGCPHCGRAKDSLAAIAAEAPGIRIVEIELGASDRDDAVFDATLAALGIDPIVDDLTLPVLRAIRRHAEKLITLSRRGQTETILELARANATEMARQKLLEILHELRVDTSYRLSDITVTRPQVGFQIQAMLLEQPLFQVGKSGTRFFQQIRPSFDGPFHRFDKTKLLDAFMVAAEQNFRNFHLLKYSRARILGMFEQLSAEGVVSR